MHAGFRKRVYNDIDGDLINLFQVMANDELRPQLLRRCRWLPPSRQIFDEDHKRYLAGGLSFRLITDPVDRARAIFYRSCFAFGGKIRSGGFQVSVHQRKDVKEVAAWARRLRMFAKVGAFWRGTVIEHVDYQRLIAAYGPMRGVVFFFDPPYFDTQRYYSAKFTRADHVYLAQQLRETPAPAVGTLYDHPKVRELYPSSVWDYHEIEATKNSQNLRRSGRTSKQKVIELILTKKGQEKDDGS